MANKSHAVNWFEIPTIDLTRAKDFYEYVLGVSLSLQEIGPLKMAWFPMIEGAPGATGALMQAEGYIPSHEGTLVYLSTDDIDAALNRVVEKGGKVIRGKMAIGEYGFTAAFEDSEGNRVAFHSVS